jgi:hypothetical protein
VFLSGSFDRPKTKGKSKRESGTFRVKPLLPSHSGKETGGGDIIAFFFIFFIAKQAHPHERYTVQQIRLAGDPYTIEQSAHSSKPTRVLAGF